MAIEIILLTGKKLNDPDEGAAQAMGVAQRLAALIGSASTTVDIAIYHLNLPGQEGQTIAGALEAAVGRGVKVRVAYFLEGKTTSPQATKAGNGGDPGSSFSPEAFRKLGIQVGAAANLTPGSLPGSIASRPIDGQGHLMHSKYVIVDGQTVWMGSANFTAEAWSVQDNNIVILTCPALAKYYQDDFDQLWDQGSVDGTGRQDSGTAQDGSSRLEVAFAPGAGTDIDHRIAAQIQQATRTVHIASMDISSGNILDALVAATRSGVQVSGVYDGPQMHGVETDWARSAPSHPEGPSAAKAAAWAVIKPLLVGKPSLPFNPDRPDQPYNYMHNKVAVIDAATVVTGSFNFSENATRNAENNLVIHDPALAGRYLAYIEGLPKGW